MKCHWCHKELQHLKEETNYIGDNQWYECSDMHVTLLINKDKVTQYTLFWEDQNQNRYKMIGLSGVTYLEKCNSITEYYKASYTTILKLDYMLDLHIENDTIQFDNIIERLLKLKAFI